MPTPDFIAHNSTFFENLMEHRFLHDIGVSLVSRVAPKMVNILRAEVDRFGFDLVLSVDATTRHLQMKTRSGNPPNNPYQISEALWAINGASVVWMCYDQTTLEPTGYWTLGVPMPAIEFFPLADRVGYRNVRMQDCPEPTKNLNIHQLADRLFPENE
jgi:hypothetical protein